MIGIYNEKKTQLCKVATMSLWVAREKSMMISLQISGESHLYFSGFPIIFAMEDNPKTSRLVVDLE
jgi:hypothetical protein